MDISQSQPKMIRIWSRLKENEIVIGPRRARYAFRMNLQVLVSREFKN